jgi:hypothetical protein
MWMLRQARRLPALSCLTVGAALALVVSAMTTSAAMGAVARPQKSHSLGFCAKATALNASRTPNRSCAALGASA